MSSESRSDLIWCPRDSWRRSHCVRTRLTLSSRSSGYRISKHKPVELVPPYTYVRRGDSSRCIRPVVGANSPCFRRDDLAAAQRGQTLPSRQRRQYLVLVLIITSHKISKYLQNTHTTESWTQTSDSTRPSSSPNQPHSLWPSCTASDTQTDPDRTPSSASTAAPTTSSVRAPDSPDTAYRSLGHTTDRRQRCS